MILFVEVNLSENVAQKDSRVSELEAELARSRAECTRLSQVFLHFLFVSVVQ